jgi:hypothetical protein
MRLVAATPFASYERPYIERWAEAYTFMAQSTKGLTSLWLDTSGDQDFLGELRRVAKAMPIRVKVVSRPLHLLDRNSGLGKNIRVCAAWQNIVYEVRDPNTWLLCVESDVIVPAGGPEQLLDGMLSHPALGALSGAIPERRQELVNGTMAWRLRQQKQGLYGPPTQHATVSWYDPEGRDGIELCDAVPFGCLMVQVQTLCDVPLRASRYPELGWDQEFSVDAWAAGMPVGVDWGVTCGHFRRDYDPDYEDLRLRMTTGVSCEVGIS